MSFVMVARWRPRSGERESVLAILRELAAKVRMEPGNLQFTVHQSHNEADELLLYEVYASEEAFAAHQQTEHFKTLVLARAVPLLETRERRSYSILDDN